MENEEAEKILKIGYNEDRLHIETGPACNNNCLFCMESRGGRKKRMQVLSRNIETILKKNKYLDTVFFTSLEPTLNPRILEYIRLAKNIGYKEILLITNGRRLSYLKFAHDLAKAGLTGVTVSIQGHNKGIHESLTRSPGSFEQTLKGIKNLSLLKQKYSFSITTNTVLVKQNYEYMSNMIDLLAPLNVDKIHFLLVEVRGRNVDKFDIIAPKYTAAGKRFCIAVESAVKNGVNPSRLGILAPFCIVRHGFQRFVLGVEIRHIPADDMEKMEVIEPSDEKVKGDFCKKCIYDAVCGGVSRVYVDKMGFGEFKPIPPEG